MTITITITGMVVRRKLQFTPNHFMKTAVKFDTCCCSYCDKVIYRAGEGQLKNNYFVKYFKKITAYIIQYFNINHQ